MRNRETHKTIPFIDHLTLSVFEESIELWNSEMQEELLDADAEKFKN